MPPFGRLLVWFLVACYVFRPPAINALSFNFSGGSFLTGIIFPPHPSFNSAVSAADSNCRRDHKLHAKSDDSPAVSSLTPAKLLLKHHRPPAEKSKKEAFLDNAEKDSLRIQTLFRSSTRKKSQNKKQNSFSGIKPPDLGVQGKMPKSRLLATVESGVALGSGEYFIDVFIGSPPRHFSLILDTGSDLNWLQCLPCHDCFEQRDPIYDPSASTTYRNLSCSDPRCRLVSQPENSPPCGGDNTSSSCPYYYWYGDHSNTTGDLATEVFTVNLTDADGSIASHKVDAVIFGCGHWNRGLFHGAAGLLGLGRGPLSFSSQLNDLYGHAFSYCLVDRNSDLSVTSKLILGEDPSLLAHPHLNFTSFASGKENPAETFYYLHVKGVKVGGELLDIPPQAWEVSESGSGGTIIDSGTTLSYFSDPAYRAIKQAVEKKVTYQIFDKFPVLSPCYNVSGVETVEMPSFSIVFADDVVWDFPVENYFIRFEPESIMCLAILGTPQSSLSILGNYQQQNFHILYDIKNWRLGFAPMRCAEA
ncbi:hypothetical protein HPP92_000468 [Vanilla planifolia]|uniref:Peptidase A1 domain-containing protein n=1 Tax=Vanilla planifolia TaxID=51239 RepID=A0A835VKX5_VANPL|nr:hypothetical protein HPP92_000468 [Vanilla planifolia]